MRKMRRCAPQSAKNCEERRRECLSSFRYDIGWPKYSEALKSSLAAALFKSKDAEQQLCRCTLCDQDVDVREGDVCIERHHNESPLCHFFLREVSEHSPKNQHGNSSSTVVGTGQNGWSIENLDDQRRPEKIQTSERQQGNQLPTNSSAQGQAHDNSCYNQALKLLRFESIHSNLDSFIQEKRPSVSTRSLTDFSEDRHRLCKICVDKEMSIVFLPCGHFCCCENCAQALPTCPFCRCFVESRVRTYIA